MTQTTTQELRGEIARLNAKVDALRRLADLRILALEQHLGCSCSDPATFAGVEPVPCLVHGVIE